MKLKVDKILRIEIIGRIGKQWNNEAIDQAWTSAFVDQNQEGKIFRYGNIKGKNSDFEPIACCGE